jgi:MFS family permease
MLGYAAFLRAHGRHLVFGVLLMALSSFGQTFFIALFGADLRAEYALSDGAFGTVYAVGTFASAMTLQRAGRWLDRVSVRRYTLAVAALLAAACAIMASGLGALSLALAIYLLRLGGQGLMVHTALTVTARALPAERGKALGIANLGQAAGEAVLPLAVVAGIAVMGWRGVWWLGAVTILGAIAFAIAHIPPQPALPEAAPGTRAGHAHAGPPLWRDPRLLLSLPMVLASSFIITGFFFHQGRLVEEKGWDLAWWATCFVAYALSRAFALLAVGTVIDRIGAVRVLPAYGMPLALAMLGLMLTDAAWVVPVFLVLLGLAAGMGATLLTALWMELYGPERLAEIRATAASGSVIASGVAPTLMGWLIDAGVSLTAQAAGCLAYTVLAILLVRHVRRHAHPI